MAELYFSAKAQNDIAGILEYISTVLSNSQAARKLLEDIKRQTLRLTEFPDFGTPLYLNTMFTGYRYLISGNYMIFYENDGTRVMIDRVLYAKSDYMSVLFPNK